MRRGHQGCHIGGFPDADGIARRKRVGHLPVQGQRGALLFRPENDLDGDILRKDDGPVCQGVGADRIEDHGVLFRKNDRAAGGQGVGRGTGGRGDDQSIRLERRQVPPVDGRLQFHDAGQVVPVDHHFVEHRALPRLVAASGDGNVEHHPLFRPEVALQNVFHGIGHLVQIDLGQIAEPPDVDPQDRNVVPANGPGRPQHGSVSPKDHNQIRGGGELSPLHAFGFSDPVGDRFVQKNLNPPIQQPFFQPEGIFGGFFLGHIGNNADFSDAHHTIPQDDGRISIINGRVWKSEF